MSSASTAAEAFDTRHAWRRAGTVVLPCALWTTLLWFAPAKQWPITGTVWAFFRFAFAELGFSPSMGWAIKGLLLTSLAVSVIRLFVRRPYMLHATTFDGDIRRLVLLGLLVAFPVQVALGLSPGIQSFYRGFFEPGGVERIVANGITIVVEHIWIEGVVLGLSLPPGLLAAQRAVARGGPLSRFGLGFPADGPRTASAWLGVPPAAWPALLASAVVFFLIHFTKNPFEIATSLPGGLAVGWISLRARSFWPAMLMHLVTGVVVVITIWLFR